VSSIGSGPGSGSVSSMGSAGQLAPLDGRGAGRPAQWPGATRGNGGSRGGAGGSYGGPYESYSGAHRPQSVPSADLMSVPRLSASVQRTVG
jgi:hypothetical protein